LLGSRFLVAFTLGGVAALIRSNRNCLRKSCNARGMTSALMPRRSDTFLLLIIALDVEATAGIEPACTDLQSAASPLRHVAKDHKDQMNEGRADKPI
jgi:hypothetical protein